MEKHVSHHSSLSDGPSFFFVYGNTVCCSLVCYLDSLRCVSYRNLLEPNMAAAMNSLWSTLGLVLCWECFVNKRTHTLAISKTNFFCRRLGSIVFCRRDELKFL